MPKPTEVLCTNAKSSIGDRVLGEVEKGSFIAFCQVKGDTVGSCPQKLCPSPGRFGEEFYNNSSRVGLLIKLRCVQGLHSFTLVIF